RLYSIYDVNPSVIKACLNSSQSDLKRLNAAIIALDEICKMKDFKDNFSTFKRLSNIIKDSEIAEVNESLFEEDVENELNNKFKALNLNIDDTKTYLESLFGLKNSIDLFFDSVMINHDNPKIKANRISIIGQIYKAFLKVADIKEISA
ncbi:TPA: glycine--tRNA ligase subunit beta, partial [Campylobacter fetus]|nr:glycine--tRNA ligase subunit beta [Campylobacter fetus]